jgi:hypothetical protein
LLRARGSGRSFHTAWKADHPRVSLVAAEPTYQPRLGRHLRHSEPMRRKSATPPKTTRRGWSAFADHDGPGGAGGAIRCPRLLEQRSTGRTLRRSGTRQAVKPDSLGFFARPSRVCCDCLDSRAFARRSGLRPAKAGFRCTSPENDYEQAGAIACNTRSAAPKAPGPGRFRHVKKEPQKAAIRGGQGPSEQD